MGAGVCVHAVVITMLTVIVAGAPDSSSTWTRSQPQQTLHSLMVSIDERLHTLENVRWELTLKQAEQRLDSLESSIRRLDSAFQDRLDKLERSLNSKELKDELTVEKLSHKIRDVLDSSYDRYNRRLGYTEERLEMSLKKVQMSMEASLSRMEKQQEDVQSEVLEAVTLLEDIKSLSSTTEDKLNNTHRAIQQHIQRVMTPSQEELQKISGSLEHLGSRINSSLVQPVWSSQNDGPPAADIITSLRKELHNEGTKITNKINNMYNDLWRRVVSVETLVKDVSRVANMTQREVLEEVRSLVLNDHRDFPGDSQENFLEVALDALERKLQRRLLDLGRKLEDRLDTLSATQNLVMDSCFDGGICRGLESRLSQVLEKIFDVFSDKIEGYSNRTLDLDSLVMEMMELVKSQHSQLIRTVTHNTNMVVTLAKDSSDTSKLLHNSITQLAEKTEYNFQELHDEVQEVSNTSGKICTDNEKTNEENINQHMIPHFSPRNTTDVEVSSALNTTKSRNNVTKHHNEGVLKITTDDIKPLADNSSLRNTTALKSAPILQSHILAVDSSILQVIEVMSTNLTQSQKDVLVRFLNSTISLDNLEAIIQNTEADPEDDTGEGSVEIYDMQTLNRTEVEGDLNIEGNYTTITVPSDISGEEENVSDESNTEIPVSETTIEVIINGKEIMDSKTMLHHENKTNPLEVSPDLKIQLKAYALLMKIKQGSLNITEFWSPLQELSNRIDEEEQPSLLPSLKKLCYGEENVQGFTSEHTNTIMRNRLLLINKIINDKNLSEKIENICNKMTESLTTQDVRKDIPIKK